MFSEQVGEIIIAVDGDEEDNGKHCVTLVSLKFKVQISLSLYLASGLSDYGSKHVRDLSLLRTI